MKRLARFLIMTGLLALGLMAGPAMANKAGSLGKITVGTDVSEWNIGTGQSNGEFVVSKLQGIELGLRAQERFESPITVTGDQGNRVGVYEADTGGREENNATWNYDFHVDLSNAKGNAQGSNLDGYRLFLEQNFTERVFSGVPASIPLNSPSLAGCVLLIHSHRHSVSSRGTRDSGTTTSTQTQRESTTCGWY